MTQVNVNKDIPTQSVPTQGSTGPGATSPAASSPANPQTPDADASRAPNGSETWHNNRDMADQYAQVCKNKNDKDCPDPTATESALSPETKPKEVETNQKKAELYASISQNLTKAEQLAANLNNLDELNQNLSPLIKALNQAQADQEKLRELNGGTFSISDALKNVQNEIKLTKIKKTAYPKAFDIYFETAKENVSRGNCDDIDLVMDTIREYGKASKELGVKESPKGFDFSKKHSVEMVAIKDIVELSVNNGLPKYHKDAKSHLEAKNTKEALELVRRGNTSKTELDPEENKRYMYGKAILALKLPLMKKAVDYMEALGKTGEDNENRLNIKIDLGFYKSEAKRMRKEIETIKREVDYKK